MCVTGSAKPIFYAVLFLLLVTIMFSTIGMALFKDLFWSCNDDSFDGIAGQGMLGASLLCNYSILSHVSIFRHHMIPTLEQFVNISSKHADVRRHMLSLQVCTCSKSKCDIARP